MSEQPAGTAKRTAYKAAEVCEIARIQPYVLRSWETEFPRLGVVRGGARIYRQADLDQVLRIKQLVFDEGLTLAGARRRIEEDGQPQPELPLEEFITPELRERIAHVRNGLQDLLGLLGGRPLTAATVAGAGITDRHLAGGDTDAPRLRSADPNGRIAAPAKIAGPAGSPKKKPSAPREKAKRAARPPRRHIGRA